MCGIAGFFGNDFLPKNTINRTLNLMSRRGPDFSNFKIFTDKKNSLNLFLLHSRLSIIDLEKRSNQPFTVGNYTIIFNGEIYNYLELKKKLISQGVKFNTLSDTEVLLKAYIHYGVKCFDELEGMWAFAIWDDKKKELILSRDRFGEKPLYFYNSNKGIFFASETKLIRELSSDKLEVNYDKVTNYILNGFKSVHKNSETYFNKVESFKPGNYRIINFESIFKNNAKKYWELKFRPRNISFYDAVDEVKFLLNKSIKYRLRSDVPIGFCLSGGIDSNTLVAIAKKKFHCDFNTYSIVDNSSKIYNELTNITKSQKYLKLKHKNFFVTSNKVNYLDDFEKFIKYYEQPIPTSNYFLQHYLMKFINKDKIKVVFSGTGADEIFSGYYDHILQYISLIKKDKNFKEVVKKFKLGALKYIHNPIFKDPYYYIKDFRSRSHIYPYVKYKKYFEDEAILNLKAFNEENFCTDLMRNRMQNELFHEGVPICLDCEDKNAMYYSIENRSPYLDKKLVEFVYSVPTKHLMKFSRTKSLLREASKGLVIEDVLNDQEKKGFNVSVNSLFNLDNLNTLYERLGKNNPIFSLIKKDKINNIIKDKKNYQENSKLIFSLISSAFFLKEFS
jgi:asparagine synthase (glutamine-hydrolysing)